MLDRVTEAELLAKIMAAPDDDQARLVYADWLTSNEDPRGELILLQCRLAAAPDDEAHRKLKVAENRLLKQHAKAWTADLPSGVTKSVFYRGFLHELTVDVRALDDIDTLLAAAPLVRHLRLDAMVMLDAGARRPLITEIVASKRLAQLESLDIRVYGVGEAAVRQIASASHLQNLRSLRLSGINGFSDELAAMTGPPLKRFGRDALEALVHAPALKRVTSLELSENNLSGDDIAALPGDMPLESLELHGNRIGAEGVRALARAPFKTLRHLGIACGLDDGSSLGELATAPPLATLESLDVERCNVGAHVGVLFHEPKVLPALKTLRLERNRLCDAGAVVIANSPTSARLTSLEMGHNLIGKKGAAALASSPHLSNLKRLLLNEPRWKDETLDLFRQSTTLTECRIYMRGHLLSR